MDSQILTTHLCLFSTLLAAPDAAACCLLPDIDGEKTETKKPVAEKEEAGQS